MASTSSRRSSLPISGRPNWIIAVIVAVWLFLALWLTPYWHLAYSERGVPIQSEEIAALTAKDDRVLIVGADWDPHILYYADRWGMMMREPPLTKEIMESQSDLDSYTTLVSMRQSAPRNETRRSGRGTPRVNAHAVPR